MHLTRTFLPRRSLQTTSIILSGATHGVGWKAAESGLQGSPRIQDPAFESYVYPSTSQIRIVPGRNSQDRGPKAAAPPPSRRLKAPPQLSQARTPLMAVSHHFSPTPDLSTRPLTSKRLEPADATTSSLEAEPGSEWTRRAGSGSEQPEVPVPAPGSPLHAPLTSFRSQARMGLRIPGAASGSRVWAGDSRPSVRGAKLGSRSVRGRGRGVKGKSEVRGRRPFRWKLLVEAP